ncbi:MAG: NAD(P)/FAD-dependent oxidoreductase [Proteobacteria bacterium]|nr:NAD(P)/FAD-dependent oxidoreductase [Pseudomonadota bacterium]
MSSQGKQELVVIGNGMAGVSAVEEILRLDPHRYNITIFGKEKLPNYNRVLLGDILTEKKDLKEITLNDFDWYEKNGITLHTGNGVKEINRGKRIVVADNGEEIRYDKLLLATGSLPFVPPIPGTDKEGVIAFRNVKDCEKISEASKKAKKATVIGGGVLGLEAAHGLHTLGFEVTVVHLMDRLMERNLDPVAATYLKEDLEKMGMTVLLGKATTEVLGKKKVTGLKFKDGSSIKTDLVIMGAGIKPNADLARESGIYCERGIVVSDAMQTYDPAIYAIGECVQHRGQTFGLVAQVFEHGRILANHLAGDGRLSFKNSSTSLKLKIPGIELYSAGTIHEDTNVETLEFHDRGRREYKRLYLNKDRIDGLVMYGDVADGSQLFQSLIDGEDISEKRRYILLGEGPTRKGGSLEAMPDSTIVCGCNGVTKGTIVNAIKTQGLFTLDEVKDATKASASCGGCSGMVEQILSSVLGASFQGEQKAKSLCPCTKYTRDDVLKNIRERHLTSVADVMDTLGWETVGCDKCRPAINYYVSIVWPKEHHDDPTSRLVNERVHANIQKNGTFSVIPRMYGGMTTPKDLMKIAEVATKYDVPLVKVTGGQRIDLLGIEKDKLTDVWKDLDMPSGYAYGKALRTVKTCVGSKFCRYGTQDSLNVGAEMEKQLEGLWMPAKVKLGINGCPRNCAEAFVKDVGIIGVTGGWEIYVGGAAGISLRGADLLCTVETDEDLMEIVSAFIQYYREEAHYGERSSKFMERVGLEKVKNLIVNDLDMRKELVERINVTLSLVKDPWKEKIGEASAAA